MESDILSWIAIGLSVFSIITSFYLNKKNLTFPNQRKSLKKLISLIDNEIKDNEMFYSDFMFEEEYIEYQFYTQYDLTEELEDISDLYYYKFFKDFKYSSDYADLPKKAKIKVDNILNETKDINLSYENDITFPMKWCIAKFKKVRMEFYDLL